MSFHESTESSKDNKLAVEILTAHLTSYFSKAKQSRHEQRGDLLLLEMHQRGSCSS
jgi:hypothetical protein